MKSSVVAISALFLASSAHAQGENPTPGPREVPASPAAAATSPTGTTPATATTSPAAELSAQQAAPNQGATDSATSPMLTPPLASPGPAATPAPLETKPAAAPEGARPPALGPMKIDLPNATIKFGFLLQPQYEAVGHPTLNSATNNIYLRRTRIIIGATLYKNFEFFLDTDYPNLMKAADDTQGDVNNKAAAGMNIQDAFATAKAGDALKVDVGYMLTPGAHNAMQGAGMAAADAASRVIEIAEENPAPLMAGVGPEAEEILRYVRETPRAEQDIRRLDMVGLDRTGQPA